MWHFEKKGEKKENQNKWLKSNVPLYSFTHDGSRSTHDHTLEHPVDSSGRRAAHRSFPPSPSLSLSLSLTLASSLPAHLLQPPPPASLFFHRSPHLLFLCQTKCTHPLILSAHYFFFLDISPHPLTRSAPWKQISVGGTIRCAFPHAIYKLILVWWTISKDIFSRNKTKPVMKG